MLRRSSGPKWISKLQKSITRKKIMTYILGFFENLRFFFHIGGILGAPRPRYSYAASATGTALFTASMNTGNSTLMHAGWDGTEMP